MAREAGVVVYGGPAPSAVPYCCFRSPRPVSPSWISSTERHGAESAVAALASLDHTVVLFESGTRIARLLAELSAALGPREATVLREMTKLHEEHRTGTLPELAEWAASRAFKGEVTLVLGGRTPEPFPATSVSSLGPRFLELRAQGHSARAAAKLLAKELGLSSRGL
jgi:16S rRNA (cytidine1402-2'-O)-methyltransferase